MLLGLFPEQQLLSGQLPQGEIFPGGRARFVERGNPYHGRIADGADIITSFADDYSMLNAQGGFIQNGRLYFGQGKPADDSVCLRVIDLYGIKKMESYINLSAGGFTFEPEGMFEYQGELMMTVYGASIARVMI